MTPFFLLAILGATAVRAETNSGGYDCTHTVELVTLDDARAKLPKRAKPTPDQWFVVDARPESAYAQGRLPGSVSMPNDEWTQEKAGLLNSFFGHPERWGKVIDHAKEIEGRLESMGFVEGEPILVVGDSEFPGEEGRAAWNLMYWGAMCIKILDGGFSAWKKAGLPIETVSTPRLRGVGDFVVRLQSRRRAQASDVPGAQVILDARPMGEFKGETKRAQKEGGHISRAKNLDIRKLYRPGGNFISEPELRNLLGDAFVDFNPKKHRAVAYGLDGVSSALLAVFVEMNLDIPVANYDGGLLEWSRLGKRLVGAE